MKVHKKLIRADNNTKIYHRDVFYCKRCSGFSHKDKSIPCPRGGCEAEYVGIERITKEIILNPIKIKNLELS